MRGLFLGLCALLVAAPRAGWALPPSLKGVAVPEPPNLAVFVKDKAAAIRLGKALFWDMQVGSDGVQSCASCHFSAGADIRARNQLTPGLIDTDFPAGAPPVYASGDVAFGNSTVPGKPGHPGFRVNLAIAAGDFPFHERAPATQRVPRPDEPRGVTSVSPGEEFATVVRDTNDVLSSQGVRLADLLGLAPAPSPFDLTRAVLDPVFSLPSIAGGRTDVRRVEPRNAPTTINAIFNFDNFWDGRASAVFNGLNPFGFRDQAGTLKRARADGSLEDVVARIPNGSLASQAVGPPLSAFEMSARDRAFPLLGRKLLARRPLALQRVDPQDSVLGSLSRAPLGSLGLGLNATYDGMVKDAFQNEWWSSTAAAGGFTQMELNFSLFFGLAVQLYEATLVADDTPYDRFTAGDTSALTPQQQLGMDVFFGTNLTGLNTDQSGSVVNGRCNNCHSAPEFTNHSVRNVQAQVQGAVSGPAVVAVPRNIIEVMVMGNGKTAFYDNGMYNIARRKSTEDVGRAATAPFVNPLTGAPFPLSYVELALLKRAGQLPGDVARFVPDIPAPDCDAGGLPGVASEGACVALPADDRVAVTGSFKASSLRNVELNGPYFHDGGESTLRQLVEFYVRGGNFPATNIADLDPDIEGIAGLDPLRDAGAEAKIQALTAFLARGLTDPRVRFERAPFDHPQLFVPEGVFTGIPAIDIFRVVPAVGAAGRVSPVPGFLGLDPQAR